MCKEITRWIFPSNPEKYDALGAFAKFGFMDWGTNHNVEIDDIVYIYFGKPYSKILLKTKVTKTDVKEEELIDDNTFIVDTDSICEKKRIIRLELIESFLAKEDYLSYNKLLKHGLKGPIHFVINLNNNTDLLEYIKLVEV